MGLLLSPVVLCAGVVAVTGFFAPVGHAQPAPRSAVQVDAQKKAAAKKLVDEGIAAQEAKDYDRAIDLYITAFSLVSHPLLLFNIAQSHRLAGRPERAVPFYEQYLALDPNGTEAGTARAYLAEAKLAPVRIPMGRLNLTSKPEGLSVILDGAKIGVTPLTHDLAAGSHAIVLLDGDTQVGERTVQIRAGVTVEATMLVVYPAGNNRAQASTPPSPAGLVSIALWTGGGLAIVTSSYMFYLGQQGGPDNGDDQYVYPYATGMGVTLVGVGAAAIGAGFWLWLRGSYESRDSAPVAAIGREGGFFGWQGRF